MRWTLFVRLLAVCLLAFSCVSCEGLDREIRQEIEEIEKNRAIEEKKAKKAKVKKAAERLGEIMEEAKKLEEEIDKAKEVSEKAEPADEPEKQMVCQNGLRVYFSGINSPKRRRLQPRPMGRLYICAPDNPRCIDVPKRYQERISRRDRRTGFKAEFFARSGITITKGDYIKIYLRDYRAKRKIWGSAVGFKDFPIGSKIVLFSGSNFTISHKNFEAKVTCLD